MKKLLLIALLIVGCAFTQDKDTLNIERISIVEFEKQMLYKQNAISISSSIFIGGVRIHSVYEQNIHKNQNIV